MTTKETLEAIRNLLGKHVGNERDLLESLEAESEGWRMRIQELDEEENE